MNSLRTLVLIGYRGTGTEARMNPAELILRGGGGYLGGRRLAAAAGAAQGRENAGLQFLRNLSVFSLAESIRAQLSKLNQ